MVKKKKSPKTLSMYGIKFDYKDYEQRMMPEGAKPWNGPLTKKKGEKSITVKFDVEGVYGYKCTPHAMLGMVGLIAVGDSLTNLKAAKEATQTIAGGKARFKKYFSLIE